jgi:hypothetical protein
LRAAWRTSMMICCSSRCWFVSRARELELALEAFARAVVFGIGMLSARPRRTAGERL